MPTSEAQKRAVSKWTKSRDNIMIRPDKETGAAIRAAAAEAGQSNQQYILQATLDRMNGTGGGDPYGLDREKLQQHTQETGETVPAFLNRAVDETIERDIFTATLWKDQKKIFQDDKEKDRLK